MIMKLIVCMLAVLFIQGCSDTRSSETRVFVRNSLSKLPEGRGTLFHSFSEFEKITEKERKSLLLTYDSNWYKEVGQYGKYKITGVEFFRHKTEYYIIAVALIGFVGSHETLYLDGYPPKATAAYYLTPDRDKAFVSFEELLSESQRRYENRR